MAHTRLLKRIKQLADANESLNSTLQTSSDLDSDSRTHYLLGLVEFFNHGQLGNNSKILNSCIQHIRDQIQLCAPAAIPMLIRALLDGFAMPQNNGQAIELLPAFLDALKNDEVDLSGVGLQNVSRVEFCASTVRQLAIRSWSPTVVLPVLSVLKELDIDPDTVRKLVERVNNMLPQIDIGQYPALTYQLLLLASKDCTTFVLRSVIALYDRLDNALLKKPVKSTSSKVLTPPQCQLIGIEGTVLLHFSFAFQQDPEVGNQFLSMMRAKHIPLSVFSLAVLLTLARIQRYRKRVLVFLKQLCVASFKHTKNVHSSPWLQQLHQFHQHKSAAPVVSNVATSSAANPAPNAAIADSLYSDFYAIAMQCVDRSVVRGSEWDYIFPSLVELGLELLDTPLPRADIGVDLRLAPDYTRLSTAANAVGLGAHVLLALFKSQRGVQDRVMEQTLMRLVTTVNHGAPALYVLAKLASEKTSLLQDTFMSRLKDALIYLPAMSPSLAQAFLNAVRPLLETDRTELRDHATLVLRKSIFSRDLDSRRVSVAGFMVLLGCSRNRQSTTTSSSSSGVVGADTNWEWMASQGQPSGRSSPAQQGPDDRVTLFLDLAGFMRRALSQQASVRQSVYDGCRSLFAEQIALRPHLLDLLHSHALMYIDLSKGSNAGSSSPFRLATCLDATQSETMEPLASLLHCMLQCLLAYRRDEDDDEPSTLCATHINAVSHMFNTMVEKLVAIDSVEQLDIEFVAIAAQKKRGSLFDIALDCIEVVIEYVVRTNEAITSAIAQNLYRLFALHKSVSQSNVEAKLKAQKQAKASKSAAAPAAVAEPVVESERSKPDEHTDVRVQLSMDAIITLLDALYGQGSARSTPMAQDATFKRWLIQRAVALLAATRHSMATQRESSRSRSLEAVIKLAPLLFRAFESRPASAAESTESQEDLVRRDVKGEKSTPLLLLEGIDHCAAIADFQKADNLLYIMQQVLSVSGTESEPKRYLACMQRWQKVFEHRLHRGELLEARAVSEIMDCLLPHLDAAGSTEHAQWSANVCEQEVVQDAPLARQLVAHHLRCTSADAEMLSMRAVCAEMHACLGDHCDPDLQLDQNMRVVNQKSWPAIVLLLCETLEARFADADFVLAQLKVLLGALAAAEDELSLGMEDDSSALGRELVASVMKLLQYADELFVRLLASLMALGELTCCSIGNDAASEPLLRLIAHAYKVLIASSKLVLATKRHPSRRFVKLIEFSGLKFTQPIYELITHLQSSQLSAAGTSKLSKISKFKLLRERKLIPQVVFQIEHFELAVIRFSKVTKTDIDKYLRRATARDFKFDVNEIDKKVKELEKNKDKSEQGKRRKSKDGDDDVPTQDLTQASEDSGRPSKKSKT